MPIRNIFFDWVSLVFFCSFPSSLEGERDRDRSRWWWRQMQYRFVPVAFHQALTLLVMLLLISVFVWHFCAIIFFVHPLIRLNFLFSLWTISKPKPNHLGFNVKDIYVLRVGYKVFYLEWIQAIYWIDWMFLSFFSGLKRYFFYSLIGQHFSTYCQTWAICCQHVHIWYYLFALSELLVGYFGLRTDVMMVLIDTSRVLPENCTQKPTGILEGLNPTSFSWQITFWR